MADAAVDAMPLLELRGIAKRYGGVRALEDVDFACRPGSIHAVVVMTDGRDENSKTTLPELRQKLRSATKSEATGDAPVKLFTIAYGDGAETKVLDDIAEAAGGWSGKGNVDTIRDVYVEVASFF